MKKRGYMALIVLAGLLVAPANVLALSIHDVDPGDLNSIIDVDPLPDGLEVFEDYNETHLIPYESHDGFAIVNERGGYFDKVVTFDATDDGPVWLEFLIHNTTPWCWSDYHFEFWNEDFTSRQDFTDVVLDWGNDVIFQNSSLDGGILQFWAPDWHCPGETYRYAILMDLQNMFPPGDPSGGTFGLRQVATTVPEPLTMAGVFLGVAGLARYVKKRRMA